LPKDNHSVDIQLAVAERRTARLDNYWVDNRQEAEDRHLEEDIHWEDIRILVVEEDNLVVDSRRADSQRAGSRREGSQQVDSLQADNLSVVDNRPVGILVQGAEGRSVVAAAWFCQLRRRLLHK
jgi:hypothetical protein